MATKVKLSTQDGDVIEVDREIAAKSHFINTIIDDTGCEEEIPLPNVKTSVLKKILAYCELHRDDNPPEIEQPLKSNKMSDIVQIKDAIFIDALKLEDLYEIIQASNYLNIKGLTELSCAKVATFIKDKNVEEIRQILSIQNDLSKEEEQTIKDENKWAEENS